MVDISLIKQRISCIDYCQSKGIPISNPGGRCVSPLRSGAKNKTSFVCYEDWWYDFGQGIGGDVIDLAAEYECGGDKGSAIRLLAKNAGVEDDTSSVGWLDYFNQQNAKIALWHQNLSDKFRKYCNDRGIKDETIDRLRIGQTPDGRLCIPYYKGKDSYVAYYITRYMEGGSCPDSKYMKQKKDDFCEHIPWGMWTLDRSKDLLVIAEGAFDVMSFEQEGYACLSAITGHFSHAQLPSVLAAARSFKKVFLVYDNDAISGAGEKFTIKMAKILFTHNIDFVIGKVPEGYKDVSEYYQVKREGSLQKLIDDAQEGDETLCSMLTDRSDFETVIRKACRYKTKSDVEILFDKIEKTGKWPDKWLKVLKKECLAAPSDDSIVKEIARKYNLKYHGSCGFVEYNGKYWEFKDDDAIKAYINDALGVYRTGSKLNSVLGVLKAEVYTTELLNLNRRPVVNFKNGTLELEPQIVFRDHHPDDLCTYCHQYIYDPDARSDLWESYLQTVTDYDDKKIALLQEFAGYCLFTDCSLHKALALIGEGRNGKSIYANAIVDVLGKPNRSTVSMNELTEKFQSIALMNSLINVASETRSDVTGCEDKFKKAVVGETLRDAYKGKDVIDFEPRAKWFMLCNNFMVSKTDASDGWIKRFCFCEFKLQFVDEPRLPHERKADRTLEAKLKNPEQLSAIFNWLLAGYRVLKATMKFTEPDDQKATTEDFIETTNPLVVFAKEFDIMRWQDHSITNDDIYTDYKYWAAECNHKPLTKTSFAKRLPKVMREYRQDLEPYRNSSARGWRLCEEQLKIEEE